VVLSTIFWFPYGFLALLLALGAGLVSHYLGRKRDKHQRVGGPGARPLLGPPLRTARQLRLEHQSELVPGTIDASNLAFTGVFDGVSFRLQLIERPVMWMKVETNLISARAGIAVRNALARPDVATALADLRARIEWQDGLLCLSRDNWPDDAIVTMTLIRLVVGVRRSVEQVDDAVDREQIPGAVYRTPKGTGNPDA
jgi:hypothetical protein